jgi:hypothetical protein
MARHGTERAQGFQLCAFTEELEEAKEFRSLLRENNISALIKRKTLSGDIPGFGLFVSEDDIDEAQVILESHSAYTDFYEIAFDENPRGTVDESEYDF